MVGSGSSCKLAMSNSAADENREVCEWLLMLSCRIGMSLVTATWSGVSCDCVLECAAELTANEDPDCRESRPPADVSSCSSILKEGIGCCAPLGTGFRRRELLDRLDRLEPTGSGDVELAAFRGMGGSFLLGGGDAASDMAMGTEDVVLVKLQTSARTYNLAGRARGVLEGRRRV
jgi:hypothetical protein